MSTSPKKKDWWHEKTDPGARVVILSADGRKVQFEYEGNFRRGVVSQANFLTYYEFEERGR